MLYVTYLHHLLSIFVSDEEAERKQEIKYLLEHIGVEPMSAPNFLKQTSIQA